MTVTKAVHYVYLAGGLLLLAWFAALVIQTGRRLGFRALRDDLQSDWQRDWTDNTTAVGSYVGVFADGVLLTGIGACAFSAFSLTSKFGLSVGVGLLDTLFLTMAAVQVRLLVGKYRLPARPHHVALVHAMIPGEADYYFGRCDGCGWLTDTVPTIEQARHKALSHHAPVSAKAEEVLATNEHLN